MWHDDVHHHQVWLKGLTHFYSFGAILSLTHNRIPSLSQRAAQDLSNERGVIYDQDSNTHRFEYINLFSLSQGYFENMDFNALINDLVLFLTSLSGLSAYAVILGLLLLCGLGLPLPEDVTLVSAGILAGMGNIHLSGALVAGFVGVLIGDAFLFTIGRTYGRRVFEWPVFRRVFTPKRVALAERKILSNSRFICFTARFLPGLRSPIYLTAGTLGVRPLIFYGLDGLAALISVPVWVLLGWWFGQNIDAALEFASSLQKWVLLGVVGLIIGYIAIKFVLKKRREKLSGLT